MGNATQKARAARRLPLMILTRTTAALLAVLGAAAPLSAGAAATFVPITVTGSGTVTSAPDLVVVSMAVDTHAATASLATQQNNAIYVQLRSREIAAGVKPSDVRTTGFNLSYTPPRVSGSTPPPYYQARPGYDTSRTIAIRSRNVGLAGKIVDSAVAAGVRTINQVEFTLADPVAARRNAIGNAVRDARATANAMAAAANLRIVGVQAMRYGQPVFTPGIAVHLMAQPAAERTVLPPQNVQTQAEVTVVYEAR